ncbi:hypothetical protein M7I_3758 [Glarea lozoyensis 74030]|uniref:Uncharacterized protein n=1 Tax=Glarea lozoyensis (strain ATCC 74030 / MF5533) TaxID=1104152 RepID=H0EMC6_GLAL7|nr:hypothetical protein M7I_3758 [Glarea lozoyensis 74030]
MSNIPRNGGACRKRKNVPTPSLLFEIVRPHTGKPETGEERYRSAALLGIHREFAEKKTWTWEFEPVCWFSHAHDKTLA